ncbi:GIY-YIG nuclease family protein [Pontibacter sp. H259]|uniref:GIY-YIG nuclease family protein n=1 Tax=Pontibacter sp. H259 TaxID=3133421 RepID=UPI0030BA97C8
MDSVKKQLLEQPNLWSRKGALESPCPIPKSPGVYAWYFKEIPPGVPTEDCHRYNDYTLLYVGISPKAPPVNGAKPSSQTIRHRLRYHYNGNAEGSTLRLTLGCLLSSELGIQLRGVGSGNRLTFSKGEAVLSEWMNRNAFIAWCEHPTPWEPEEELIKSVYLPLNLDQNKHHPFYHRLKEIRQQAKAEARSLPIIS